ncbi:MAG: PQQ-dependent sugar dehydrogenase [Saprospiraceae bacterium]
MLRRFLFLLGIFSIAFCWTDCKLAKQGSAPAVKATRSLEVREGITSPGAHYKEFCASCHGANLKTFVTQKWKYGESKEEIMQSIRYGIEDAGMPAYDTTFTQTELEALSLYILEGINNRKETEAAIDKTAKYYQTKYHRLRVEEVITDLEVPWGIKVTKNGTIFFTERQGTLKCRQPDGTLFTIEGTPKVNAANQGGMLDVALHPDFEKNQLLYLSYSKINSDDSDLTTTAVLRAKLVGKELTEQQDIFEALPYTTKRHHYGSRLVFDAEGLLYISVGDRGNRDRNPQYLDNGCGKIHRVHDDGRIPMDNPFYGKEGIVASIWTYGNRNPQGLVYDVLTQKIWAHEHGPKGGDELNLVKKGKNYGWPEVSYGINYNGTRFTDITEKEGIEPPLTFWTPSIAPSGMALVLGTNYPAWQGNILTGSLRFDYVSRIKMEGNKVLEEEKILEDIGRVRAIEMGADGFLYLGVEDPGRILKIRVVD